jgi:hypothetical protein
MLNDHMDRLPDGTNRMEESVLNPRAGRIRIDTTNFEYQRFGN